MGEAQDQHFQLSFNPRLRIEFQGSRNGWRSGRRSGANSSRCSLRRSSGSFLLGRSESILMASEG